MIGQLLDRRYRITEILGSAEYGQIYLAKDTRRPGHPVCFVKHLKPSSNDVKYLENARRLFDKEAEILEKLGQHEQIPQLFAYFEENKEFFLVEEFIPGHPLVTEILPGKPLSEEQVISILKEILEILLFVHQHGAIHRDIKPSNLIRRHPDGKLVLIDFGAVKEIGNQVFSGENPATARIGTLEYMPIEQFQYNPQLNSDIYALGIIGIQALTGLPIYELPKLRNGYNSHTCEIVWRHLAIVSPELADIIDRMVRYDYRQRYQSVTEVLGDLLSIGDRTKGRLPKLTIYLEEVERRVSSRGEISVVGRTILDALCNSLELLPEEAAVIEAEVLRPYQDYQQKLQQYKHTLINAMQEESPLSQETREELKRLQQVLEIKDRDVIKIEEKINHTKPPKTTPQIPKLPQLPKLQINQYLPNLKNSRFLIISSIAGVIGLIGVIFVISKYQDFQKRHQVESQQLKEIQTFYQERKYEECIKSGEKLPKNSQTQNILNQCQEGINWKNPQVTTLTGHTDSVGAVAFSSDGKNLASGSKDKTIKIWELATGKIIHTLEGDKSPVWAVVFSSDNKQLVTGSFFWRVLLWNWQTEQLLNTGEHKGPVWSVAISPNGKFFASASEDKLVTVWNLETGKLVYNLPDHFDYVYSIAISKDSKYIVSGSRDKTIKIWELNTGRLINNLEGHKAEVRSVAITPDGKNIVSGSYDKTIKIWDFATGKVIRTIESHSDDIVAIAISPDGKTIASGSKDKTIKLWNLNTGELINTLPENDEIYTVAFSPDGNTIASAGKDITIRLWRR